MPDENTENADPRPAGDETPTEEDVESPDDAGPKAGVLNRLGRLLRKDPERERTPLELRTQILDEIERSLRPYRAERPISFNRVNVHLLAPTSRQQALYEAAIEDRDLPFPGAVRSRLREAGFSTPTDLVVKTYVHREPPRRLTADFEEYGPVVVELKSQALRTKVTLTVVAGTAEKETYRFSGTATIHLGRLREVTDSTYGQVVRRNDIAFLDPGDPSLDDEERAVNETVSRRHARIVVDPGTGNRVLHNEAGSTSVARETFPRPVRVGKQPVPLEDGDLIYLGRACLRYGR